MEFYTTAPAAPGVTRIRDIAGVYAYLVEGTQRAVLIDTCCGVGDLRALVAGLTQKPLEVICTHGHVDHASGAGAFESVWMNEKDWTLLERHTSIELRGQYVDSIAGAGVIPLEAYVPGKLDGYRALTDGQTFELGGITLEAIALPGHTAGMTCILLCELRTLLLGDACNSFTFLFLPESSSVQAFSQTLQSLLQKHGGRFDSVWFSHGHNTGQPAIIEECIRLCDEILAGQDDAVPFQFMELQARLAKAVEPNMSRVDGGLGNIIYHPEKLRG